MSGMSGYPETNVHASMELAHDSHDDFQEWDLLFSNDRIIPRFHILVFSGRGAGG